MIDIKAVRSVPTGIRLSVREQMLSELFSNAYCKKCGLYKRVKTPYIEGRGNKEAPLLIVGEAPGANEDKDGNVFIGKAGSILQNKLNQHNIDCFITNSVKCRPTDKEGKNKKPTPTQIKCCRTFTYKLIDEIKPKVILTLGKTAMDQMLGLGLAMTIARGKQFYHPELECTIVTTYHPMYLGYRQDALIYQQFEEDILMARKLAYEPKTRLLEATPVSLSDPIEIKAYLNRLLDSSLIAMDIETDGLNPRENRITHISFCIESGKGVHIKWEDILPFFDLLNQILSHPSIVKVFHNGVFDVKFLRAVGLTINNFGFDTLYAEHTTTMSYEGREVIGLYKLKTMAWTHTPLGGYEDILGEGGIVATQKKQKTKKKKDAPIERTEFDNYAMYVEDKKQARLKRSGLPPVPYYSALDSDVTFRIYQQQVAEIGKTYNNLFYHLIMPLANTLLRIEENGIRIDVAHMEKVKKENNSRAAEIEELIYARNGGQFDINSAPQLRKFVFNKLKITKSDKFKTPKGDPSLNEAAIKYYAETYPELANILEYRKINKQTSTYIDGFLDLMDPNTQRVYPGYLQHTTATGRLSCINPPLQTVPRDNRIRNMIIPAPGNKLLAADLGQAELRVLAMFSGDVEMIKAFKADHDIHAATACNALLHISYEQFDKNNEKHMKARTIAKTINFGIVYGLSAFSLATQLGYPMDTSIERHESTSKAQKFIDSWFNLYSGAKQWLKAVERFAIEYGYVESAHGRRRYLSKVYSTDTKVREGALRQATNMPIQATASDITNFGLIRLQKWIDSTNKLAKIVGVVHDCILVDCPEHEVGIVGAQLVKSLIEDIPDIEIGLKADLEVLDKWTK